MRHVNVKVVAEPSQAKLRPQVPNSVFRRQFRAFEFDIVVLM